jgi:outer membrane receptor for ferrienterochelin and colicin
MNHLRTTCFCFLATLLAPFLGWGGTNGTLEGLIRVKGTGEPLVGAHVMLAGTRLGGSSDENGWYAVGNIPAGSYSVRVSIIGYQTQIVNDVRIKPDLKTRLDADLLPTLVETEPVVSTGFRPPIQKDVTGTVYTQSSDVFTALPVASVGEVVGLQPGVTMENNIRGGKTTEALYLVDGLPVQNLLEGGAGSEIPQSAIGEMAIQTGGFDPEYGNALSGVINVITRRGSDTAKYDARAEKDDIFGGQQVDHRNEVDISAGGPVAPDVFYFASIRGVHTDSRWWQDMRRFFDSPIERDYNGFGKVDYLPSSSVRISLQSLYTYSKTHDYEYSWRFNLRGLPDRDQQGYRIAAILSHAVSQSFYYTASLSRYQINYDINSGPRGSVDTTMYQWDFYLRYVVGGDRAWWARKRQITELGKVDFTWRIDDHHLLKFGGEFNQQNIFSDVIRFEPQLNIFGKPFVNKPMLDYSTDYRYYPRSAAAYLQDKLELSRDGMLLNLGMRFDLFDPRAERPLAEVVPQGGNQYATQIVGTVPASVKKLFSPRIGFAAPFAASGYLFINYGEYYQFPLFDYLYSGLNNVSLQKGVGVLVGNPDLKPEGTRSWEMSIKYALRDGVVLSGTYFHKETTNLIDVKTFVPTNSSVAGDYGFAEFVNNPYARSSGLELSVVRETGKHLRGSISYTYMIAEGISEDARSGLQYYEWGLQVPAQPFPLSWDQRHTVKVVGTVDLPLDLSLSVLWVFHTGRPYTYFPSKDGFTPEDSSLTFQPNNARMSDYNVMNIKVSRTFTLTADPPPATTITAYIDGRNILNAKNVLWVDSAGKVGGELGDLSAWDPGRRVRFGIRLEF